MMPTIDKRKGEFCIVINELFETFLIGMFTHDNQIYGIQFDRNEIIMLNEMENRLQFCGAIPVKNDYCIGSKLFHRVLVENEKAFFIPFMSRELCIYDFINQVYEIVELDLKIEKICGDQGLFYEGVLYKGYIILLPFTYREIIAIDLRSKEQLVIDIEEDYPKKEDNILFRKYVWVNEDTIIVPSLSSNKCLVLNLSAMSFRVIRVGSEKIKYGAAITVNCNTYLIMKNYLGIIKLDNDFNALKLECFCDIEWDGNERKTYFDPESVVSYENYIYCFPARWNHAVKIDLLKGATSIVKSIEPYCSNHLLDNNTSIFNGAVRDGRYVYLQYQLDMILKFDLVTEQVTEYPRKICDRDNTKLKRYIEMIIDDTKFEKKYFRG